MKLAIHHCGILSHFIGCMILAFSVLFLISSSRLGSLPGRAEILYEQKTNTGVSQLVMSPGNSLIFRTGRYLPANPLAEKTLRSNIVSLGIQKEGSIFKIVRYFPESANDRALQAPFYTLVYANWSFFFIVGTLFTVLPMLYENTRLAIIAFHFYFVSIFNHILVDWWWSRLFKRKRGFDVIVPKP